MIEYKYRLIKKIYKSANSITYKCSRIYDKMPVVIKKLNRINPSPLERQIFKREYTIAKALSVPGTIEVFELEQSDDSLFIAMADGGDSLQDANLHEGNAIRFGIHPLEFAAWRDLAKH